MSNTVELFTAKHYIDSKGLTYFLNLNLSKIKRTYIIKPFNNAIARMWQWYLCRNKSFIVFNFRFTALTVQPHNWVAPFNYLKPSEHLLRTKEANVLHTPGGCVTGIIAVKPNSKLMVLSNFIMKTVKSTASLSTKIVG